MWLLVALLALALAIAGVVWGVSVLWVRIISGRWDAMCAQDEPPRPS